jgi:hypothetical protein
VPSTGHVHLRKGDFEYKLLDPTKGRLYWPSDGKTYVYLRGTLNLVSDVFAISPSGMIGGECLGVFAASERLGDRPIGFVHSRPSAPGVFENTVNSRRDSEVGATAINPKNSLCHHSNAGHSRQHKSMIANGIASTTSTTRMRATRAHESFRSHDGVGTGGPFAPVSSIASISSGMRSAKKKPKKAGWKITTREWRG